MHGAKNPAPPPSDAFHHAMAKSKEKKNKSLAKGKGPDSKKGGKFEPLDVKIKMVGENPDHKSPPVVGYFPSGYDPLKNVEASDSKSDPSSDVRIYKNANSRNPKNPRMQLVVGVNGSQMNFVGTNYSGEATTPQLCNYALGVLDKETGVLKMVPIAANRIFRLEPKIGRSELRENEQLDEAKEEVSREEKAEKFRNLTVMYSTKKDIRRDLKREALRQTEGPGTQEDADQKLKGIEIKTEALEAIASTTNARNVPPYDMGAASPDMAYPLDKIILKGEWDYLLDIFELAQAGAEVTPDVYPSFVCNRIVKLEDIEDESKKKRIAGILSYITHLIKFKDGHSMDGVSSAKRHKLPSILSQKFTSMFGGTNDTRIPDEKQKLLISYVLVLSLFADDFRSDPLDIAKDLRMSPIMLRPHYEYLGCKFVRENQVLLATLPVPLEFQTMKRKRRR
ncbi:RNA polymerase I 49 kDa subunit [Handroanthus impetiginosus]|uniref:RNA polymerase I 49 kDa subunit n=1 Tax=Handroanthus impetiginosus TaxID=429701 RepID=A0A2G9HXR6_9LAMI|nr:RNA polymerase I 49 kDa subunit [Handroanthus impetiginosus]